MSARAGAAIVICLALVACSGEPHSDLRRFVEDSENLPHGRVPPLPEVKPYEPFTYAAFDLIDPFKPRKIEPPKNSGRPGFRAFRVAWEDWRVACGAVCLAASA